MTNPSTTQRYSTSALLAPIAISLLCLALSACGQTGRLYLPEEPQQVIITEPGAVQSAPKFELDRRR